MKRIKVTLLGLLLALSVFVQATAADDKRLPLVERVGAIGMTVSDMDKSVEFYSQVLSFEKVSDVFGSSPKRTVPFW